MKRRILFLLFALLATQVGSLISPAYACGCGAMIPDGQTAIGVDRETSVVRWDGRTEQIVMRFTVGGNAQRAAWIMPVPGRATVELGDGDMFDELRELTRPERKTRTYFWPRSGDWPFSHVTSDGAGAPAPGAAPPVGVVGREQLGDFDVARLTATDPDALKNWLESNGFKLPDRLATEVKPYVDQRWEYVAIRLAPRDGGKGKVLRGDLDPLKIRFDSDRLVYPMRLSRMAKTPQSLGLYVLADHRMEPATTIGGSAPEVTFAGTIEPKDGPLAALADGKPVFLTAIDQKFPDPGRIDADHELRATPKDTPYRRAVYRNELLTVGDGIPVWLLTVSAAAVALASTGYALTRRRRRRSGRRSPATA
ncbi:MULTISPECIES: DUF2330 domain-containing protein [Streptomyces]|uniref:DUF2330 domain-containing protein n=1 Tax=Streptomyces TaxID=1883 RepID=UPI0004BE054D|nr:MULTISPECIES: DUF2330 domain-containing protein [Streptomyces]KOV01669.1 hypothetical protein ADK91_22690 [Streptomyces sp. XY511]MCI4079718.1 DUF2330 domain-containing protein [Streptomyces sp. MMS21 TC-5]QNE28952.1 DUF2330 domain-containing protein [Streptomyces sp. INR7]RST00310.1 DUF2330 domain-containing protein [Streptomyces sp. WAC05950]